MSEIAIVASIIAIGINVFYTIPTIIHTRQLNKMTAKLGEQLTAINAETAAINARADCVLDIASTVARLEQIESEGYDDGHWLLDRLVTCDLPRLRGHLTPEALEALAEAKK